MNRASLMRLAPDKRAIYLKKIAAAVQEFEVATNAKVSKEYHAMLEQMMKDIAQEIAMLPSAEAEITGPTGALQVPVWNASARSWSCPYNNLSWNADAGTCVRVLSAGTSCYSTDAKPAFKSQVTAMSLKTLLHTERFTKAMDRAQCRTCLPHERFSQSNSLHAQWLKVIVDKLATPAEVTWPTALEETPR
jgi:hypothetical protein